MVYSHEVQQMCCVKKGPNHGPAPIPEEGKWVKSKEITDIHTVSAGVHLSRGPASLLSMSRKASSRRHLWKHSDAQV